MKYRVLHYITFYTASQLFYRVVSANVKLCLTARQTSVAVHVVYFGWDRKYVTSYCSPFLSVYVLQLV